MGVPVRNVALTDKYGRGRRGALGGATPDSGHDDEGMAVKQLIVPTTRDPMRS